MCDDCILVPSELLALLIRIRSPIDLSPARFSWAYSVLDSWKRSLPAHLLFAEDPFLRATAHLDIMYNMIWVNIGRAASLRLVRTRLHRCPAAGLESENFVHTTTNSRSQELSEQCTQAAATIIEWIDLLRRCNRLAKFSFTDFHSCSSAVIVLLLNAVLHPRDPWSSPVARGIDCLRFMAGGSKLARDALYLVERLQAGIQNLITRGHTALEQQLASTPPLSPLPQGLGGNQPKEVPTFLPADNPATHTVMRNAGSDFAMLDTTIFSDLEPSLLGYSGQTLALFGFDGFCPAVDAVNLTWDNPLDPSGIVTDSNGNHC